MIWFLVAHLWACVFILSVTLVHTQRGVLFALDYWHAASFPVTFPIFLIKGIFS